MAGCFVIISQTRRGEPCSPLHYFGNCISFIRFIFIINFLPLQNYENNCNAALGHNMPLILQTVCTNWERRLAVRASNERPYRIVRIITMLRSGIICFFTLQTVCPTAIFHFQFSILHLNKLPLGRNVFLILHAIMHNAQKNVKKFTNI